ncbi:oxidoreductase [Frigidibacter sp. MR17.14]|uniref:oxidoreductase n=1 Tax=Frigidibacter sp. MR17.14 TaxID=3126509 RepID=UPI003012D0D0
MTRSLSGLLSATALTLGLALATPFAAAAETLLTAAQPQGPVLLTASGAIAGPEGKQVVELDQAMLDGLPKVTFTTTTIWTEGPQEFTGVPLGALLTALGAKGKTLAATAENDYSIEIPIEDWPQGLEPVVAYARNGKAMSIRDRGPLWIVYPYDSDARLRTEVIYSRSIWQLNRIEVRP